MFSQISGANAVFTYAPVIFSQAAAKHDNAGTQSVGPQVENSKPNNAELQNALFQTALIGIINFFATFIPILLVERVGRRPILMIGVACMAVAVGGLCCVYAMGSTNLAARVSILVAVLVFVATHGMASLAGLFDLGYPVGNLSVFFFFFFFFFFSNLSDD